MLTTRVRPRFWGGGLIAGTGLWAVPLGIFAISRLVSGLLVNGLGQGQSSSYAPNDVQAPLATDPATYLNLLTNWDGQWYLRIAEQGYPSTLPMSQGAVIENVWAFFPAFPGLIAVLGRLGIPHPLAATLVSTTCAALSMIVLYNMLIPATGRFTAAMTVTAFSFGPTSLVLQAAYTESLAILGILSALWTLKHKRYLLSALFAMILAFTRPIALPLAASMAATWVLRFRDRHTEPFPRREMVAHATLALGTAASSAVWPVVCALVTGRPNGYALTQQAWLDEQRNWSTWLSPIFTGEEKSVLALSIPVLLLTVWIAYRRAARVWGDELRTWALTYPLFILAVSRPTTSVFRYLALTTVSAWPFPDVSARVQSVRVRMLLLLGVAMIGVTSQYLWITWFWVITDAAFFGTP